MWPIDRSVFDDTDYATARTFQAVPTVPFSYPRNIASSEVSTSETDGEPADISSEDQDYIPEGEGSEIMVHKPFQEIIRLSSLPASSPPSEWYESTPSHTHMTISFGSDTLHPSDIYESGRPRTQREYQQLYQASDVTVHRNDLQQTNSDRAGAANAHCTISLMENETLWERMVAGKRKTNHKVNTVACVLTVPGGKEEWAEKITARTAVQEAEQQKQKVKADGQAAREQHWLQNIATMQFSKPLDKYIHKDVLKDLAACLNIDQNGTVLQLKARIKAHFQQNPILKQNV
ncbi:hypothetical protein M422DRAFT_54615 [Sphaerobolus stellatus SS14]|uniref:Uncharacterized protein n=1 Tax=Sphaerobolus stellatus (strain SS14) TaxID=990650 RepID=A0A0C9UHM8_SPHS4|nr:hypothetical protein M422DRAFT_54615 [Sphaerobolus stellatus SS14]